MADVQIDKEIDPFLVPTKLRNRPTLAAEKQCFFALVSPMLSWAHCSHEICKFDSAACITLIRLSLTTVIIVLRI